MHLAGRKEMDTAVPIDMLEQKLLRLCKYDQSTVQPHQCSLQLPCVPLNLCKEFSLD